MSKLLASMSLVVLLAASCGPSQEEKDNWKNKCDATPTAGTKSFNCEKGGLSAKTLIENVGDKAAAEIAAYKKGVCTTDTNKNNKAIPTAELDVVCTEATS